MGHTTEDATRAAEEREKDDLLPLSHRARMHDAVTHRGRRYDALRHWAPILRKVLLATLAGGALATVGAVSGTPGALSDRLAADQRVAHEPLELVGFQDRDHLLEVGERVDSRGGLASGADGVASDGLASGGLASGADGLASGADDLADSSCGLVFGVR